MAKWWSFWGGQDNVEYGTYVTDVALKIAEFVALVKESADKYWGPVEVTMLSWEESIFSIKNAEDAMKSGWDGSDSNINFVLYPLFDNDPTITNLVQELLKKKAK